MENEDIIINLKIANDRLLRLNRKMEDLINRLLKEMETRDNKRTDDQQ